MDKKHSRKVLIAIAVVALFSISAYAFADWGRGYGNQGWGHHGPYSYRGHMHDYWDGYLRDNLKDENIRKLSDARKEFYEETRELRNEVYEKEVLIRNELAKNAPDAKKVAKLQKELSGLRADLDEKWVAHMIAMKKINPEVGSGYAMGYGPRSGRGFGGYCGR